MDRKKIVEKIINDIPEIKENDYFQAIDNGGDNEEVSLLIFTALNYLFKESVDTKNTVVYKNVSNFIESLAEGIEEDESLLNHVLVGFLDYFESSEDRVYIEFLGSSTLKLLKKYFPKRSFLFN